MTILEGKLIKMDCGLWAVENFQITPGTVLSVNLNGSWIQGFLDHDGREYLVWGNGRTIYPCAGQLVRVYFRKVD